ncbi:hypothetical protein [Pedosphaera parvula]|uniref:Bacterial surface antigen (D15) domain-containing protein n=1 Tax=Pedosphaera parvula (strain Ellin514) TaxID=320771 RepID=B9XBN5_PEDPL|nr:hypothetical protein [Pedosphaera parvula]EEF62920.1 hypothetical protein Cflav_PD5555 [Pedosphaera parvula Ellin514]
MVRIRNWIAVLLLLGVFAPISSYAQIDPVKRELVQMGYNQPFEGKPPISGYAFLYYNQPSFMRTNLTLRLAVAPVYMDSELGFSGLLSEHTDLGIGVFGGGFANSYSEIRSGKLFDEESFTGDGGGAEASIYHLFNPDQRIPLNAIIRGELSYAAYRRDSETAPNFVLPNDGPTAIVRTGLRWGGREPLLTSDAALELSVWYEGQFRLNPGPYGFAGDRNLNPSSHLFWGRALFAYTLPKSGQNIAVAITTGASVNADRLSAFRLGGVLPLSSEFPLILPGYYFQEISATRFAMLNGSYSFPLDEHKRWSITTVGSVAGVDYLKGLNQPNDFLSGVGGGITYRSYSEAWQAFLGYSYGITAIRSGHHGANAIGLLVQFDLERHKENFYDPGDRTGFSRGFDRIMRSFQ